MKPHPDGRPIAHGRGLCGLAPITGIGTWNYQNGEVLRWSRRFRQGTPVELAPADPVQWKLYGMLTTESEYYSAFLAPKQPARLTEAFRLLAPFDPVLDRILAENQAEADRLRALPHRRQAYAVSKPRML